VRIWLADCPPFGYLFRDPTGGRSVTGENDLTRPLYAQNAILSGKFVRGSPVRHVATKYGATPQSGLGVC
jgi:hypothetical protein